MKLKQSGSYNIIFKTKNFRSNIENLDDKSKNNKYVK